MGDGSRALTVTQIPSRRATSLMGRWKRATWWVGGGKAAGRQPPAQEPRHGLSGPTHQVGLPQRGGRAAPAGALLSGGAGTGVSHRALGAQLPPPRPSSAPSRNPSSRRTWRLGFAFSRRRTWRALALGARAGGSPERGAGRAPAERRPGGGEGRGARERVSGFGARGRAVRRPWPELRRADEVAAGRARPDPDGGGRARARARAAGAPDDADDGTNDPTRPPDRHGPPHAVTVVPSRDPLATRRRGVKQNRLLARVWGPHQIVVQQCGLGGRGAGGRTGLCGETGAFAARPGP